MIKFNFLLKQLYFINLFLIVISSLAGFFLFFLFDFYFTKSNIYLNEYSDGWYELKSNFDGEANWGNKVYRLKTDDYGFRINPDSLKKGKANYIFLGDSFTFGINGGWSETFVGMFDINTDQVLINAGTSSYSPTPYLHQYRKAIANDLLSERHSVIVGIDISDVQDEAGYWVEGPSHPIKRNTSANYDYRKFIRDHFSLTAKIGSVIEQFFSDGPTKLNLFRQEKMEIRSGFTWKEWDDLDKYSPLEGRGGYAPLGVAGGLRSIEKKLSQISDIARKNDSMLYILIYPWPDQIKFKQKYDWTLFAVQLCKKIYCEGVIDAQKSFFEFSSANHDWYEKLYLTGDVHLNEKGNKIIYNSLKKVFKD